MIYSCLVKPPHFGGDLSVSNRLTVIQVLCTPTLSLASPILDHQYGIGTFGNVALLSLDVNTKLSISGRTESALIHQTRPRACHLFSSRSM